MNHGEYNVLPQNDDITSLEVQISNAQKKSKCSAGSFGLGVAVGGIVGLALFFGLYFGLPPRNTGNDVTPTNPPSSATFKKAAVAADAGPCSDIGNQFLEKGGSVVDAAVATMLCVGLYNGHSCGIGGGFFMTVYNASMGAATFLNSRETAPAAADKDMYKGNSDLSQIGTLAVAVPGEIAGYWEAHQRYGKLPWKDLFEPTIKIAEEGYVVSAAHAQAIRSTADVIQNKTFNMWPVFTNFDGSLKQEGDIVRRPQLAVTLRIIAEEGAQAFYNGRLTDDIVADLKDGFGDSIITKQDLIDYRTEVEEALNVTIDDLTVFTPGPPASGAVMALILNILDGYDITPDDYDNEDKKILTYHRINEAFRFAYAKRSSLGDDRTNETIRQLAINMTSEWFADSLRGQISDDHTWPVEYYGPDFVVPEDSGTSHLSIVGPGGNAVAITSTINTYFGSRVRGLRTGIIFNNEMDDFSSPNITNAYGIPPSPSNFIYPGNRPLSSMCPSVVVETDKRSGNYNVRMVAGASGGSQITTSTSLVILNSLFFGLDVGESVELQRIHDQLIPNETRWETGFDQMVVEGLQKKGHKISNMSKAGSVVQAIVINDDGTVGAACDSRKGGYPAGH
ncbi:unnamed protein product [Clavelina lepadiformis]|uniref:Glutathione hydrolase n=1 Tax=Clavelina lepadiformis TaxID=159417 RepID=A0ABP0GNB2_CLALP